MTAKDRIKELQREVGAGQDGGIGEETLSKFAKKYGKTRVQTIHFFANIHHESGGFTLERENMKGYSPGRIMEIFGIGKHSANVTRKEAEYLSGKPYELAERVYGLGNPRKAAELGNKRPGDGWLFRGGGALQITGGFDYKRYGGQELYDSPDKIGESAYYFTTAIKEFDAKKIWNYAKDLTESSILNVARIINVGRVDTKVIPNGLADRRAKVRYYESLWDIDVNVTPLPTKRAVTLSNLNLRKVAVSGDVIVVIPKGTTIEVIRTINNWSEVIALGKTGWVSNKYLK